MRARTKSAAGSNTSTRTGNVLPLPDSVEELEQLAKRAEAGDAGVMPIVRKLVDFAPEHVIKFFDGDPAHTNERLMQAEIAGKNPARMEALSQKLKMLRAKLCGPKPSAIECLLVERCVACWLQVQRADLNYEHRPNQLPMYQVEFLAKQQDRAHRRFVQAIKALATVRKLALPALQVNLAEKQVNVVG